MGIQGSSLYREARGSNEHGWNISQQLPGVIEALQDYCACVQREGNNFDFSPKFQGLNLPRKNRTLIYCL